MKEKSLEIEQGYVQNFLYFLLLYFLLQVLLRIFISDSLELDESEQVLLSQSFLWGYNAQPPLYTWLQILFFELFGKNIFAISLLKNFLLFLTYFFVYKSTKLITKNHITALIATASLILIPQISWESQRDLTHSVLLTTIASITFYVVMKIKYSSNPKRAINYMLLGVLIAAGMLAKYSYALYIVAMAAAALFDAKLRQFIISWKIIITVGVIVCVLLPHALWLLDHLEVASNQTVQKLNITKEPFGFLVGLWELFKAVVLFLMPYLLVVFAVFYHSIDFKKERFLRNFFIIIAGILVVFVIFSGATHIKDRWMQPYFFLMVVYVASMIDVDKLSSRSVVRYFKIIYVFMAIILFALFARVYFCDIMDKHYRLNYPFGSIAKKIKDFGFSSGLVLAENKLLGGNMGFNFPQSCVKCAGYPNSVKKKFENILIVWDKKFPAIANRYRSQMARKHVVSEKYLYSMQKEYKLNFMIIKGSSKKSQ